MTPSHGHTIAIFMPFRSGLRERIVSTSRSISQRGVLMRRPSAGAAGGRAGEGRRAAFSGHGSTDSCVGERRVGRPELAGLAAGCGFGALALSAGTGPEEIGDAVSRWRARLEGRAGLACRSGDDVLAVLVARGGCAGLYFISMSSATVIGFSRLVKGPVRERSPCHGMGGGSR